MEQGGIQPCLINPIDDLDHEVAINQAINLNREAVTHLDISRAQRGIIA